MTDSRTTPIAGVHDVRLVESPVETSAPDRRHDYVPAPRPRAIVMRPTSHTEHIATSAIDLRDDILRDEVPSIVVDSCFGIVDAAERDAIVQAIEQEDTRPIRRMAAGTTPPSMDDPVAALRDAAARRDVSAIRGALESAMHRGEDAPGDDPLAMTLARGSCPSLDHAIAFACPPAGQPAGQDLLEEDGPLGQIHHSGDHKADTDHVGGRSR